VLGFRVTVGTMDRETRQGGTPLAHDGARIGASAPVLSAPLRNCEQRKARAGHYRRRAEELRVIAEDAMLQQTQRTLLSLADSYEHMASLLDEVSFLP
jgi:hypothetical protein